MKLLIVSSLLSLILLQTVVGYIWETEESVEDRLQRVPPSRLTAYKIMWFFLNRFGERLPHSSRKSHRIRRQAPDKVEYDVAFVIDSSRSITTESYRDGLEALTMLIDRAQAETHYAAVVFSTNAEVTFTYTNGTYAKRQLQHMRHLKGWTNTQEALMMCKRDLIDSDTSNSRTNARKRLLVVTDGRSNIESNSTLYRAQQLKEDSVEIFVIAVGDYIPGILEVVGMSSSTDAHLYRVHNLKGLVEVIKLIPQMDEATWLSDMYEGGQRNSYDRRHLHRRHRNRH